MSYFRFRSLDDRMKMRRGQLGPETFEDHYYVNQRKKLILDPKDKATSSNGSASSSDHLASNIDYALTDFEKYETLGYPMVYTTGTRPKENVPFRFERLRNFTDNQGRLTLRIGDHIAYRYLVERYIANGSFSFVVGAKDMKLGSQVAVKVMDTNTTLLFAETKMLLYIQERDPKDTSFCVKLLNIGQFRSHQFLVLEYSNTNLELFVKMKEREGEGELRMKTIAGIARSIISGLCFLHRFNIIHGALEPSNILMDAENPTKLKIADFRYSCLAQHVEHDQTFGNFRYQAPELFCGGRATPASDMWSFGLIFGGLSCRSFMIADNPDDQMFLIQQLNDPVSHDFFQYCRKISNYFTNYGLPKHCRVVQVQGSSSNSRRFEIIPGYPNCSLDRLPPGLTHFATMFQTENVIMLPLLKSILKWSPHERISPFNAYNHKFFSMF